MRRSSGRAHLPRWSQRLRKSNFLDALRLVSESLNASLDHALRDRGGLGEVRRRSSGHPTNFGIRLELVLPGNVPGHFAFEVGARSGVTYVVQTEQCQAGSARYRVSEGRIEVEPGPVSPPATDDRLYLVNAAGLPPFRPVFDLLRTMGFYNLNPDQIRKLQPRDKGDLLARDGHNLASVLARLAKGRDGAAQARIEEYLSKIVEVPRPHRVSRGQLVKQAELARAVELEARRGAPGDAILVLLDADRDPACQLGTAVARMGKARESGQKHRSRPRHTRVRGLVPGGRGDSRRLGQERGSPVPGNA